MLGLDPGNVRTAASTLDSQAVRLETASDIARTALGVSDLNSPVLNRLNHRAETLRAVASELRTRAEQIENIPTGLPPHVIQLEQAALSSAGLQSIDTVAELSERIEGWNGTDNDPIFDQLIRDRDESIEMERIAAEADVQRVSDELVAAISLELGISLADAERFLTDAVAFPRQLEITSGYYRGIGAQVGAPGELTVEDIVTAVRAGEVTFESRLAATQDVQFLAGDSLNDHALVVYLTLLAKEEHQFRTLTDEGSSEEEYVNAISGHNFAQLNRLRFEQEVFGVPHFAGAGSIHDVLDLIGFIPVAGEWADGLNAGIYLLEGDKLNAAISSAALVPVVGSSATGARLLARSADFASELGGKALGTFRATDGKLIHRVELPDGTIINIIELADGSIIRAALDIPADRVDEFVEIAKRQDLEKLADRTGLLRNTRSQKGNFGMGSGTRAEADELGMAWVGPGAVQSRSKPGTWTSADGLRSYRGPSNKPRLGKTQANFEWRSDITHSFGQNNGHLDIID